MNFRLQKETQEAQRKRIEAAGIRDFQQIVAQGISPQLLEWKGIEATETLAKSANAKVVVIGNPQEWAAADFGTVDSKWMARRVGCPILFAHLAKRAGAGSIRSLTSGTQAHTWHD